MGTPRRVLGGPILALLGITGATALAVPSGTSAETSTLIASGIVWYDDGDGIREPGEPRARDAQVAIDGCDTGETVWDVTFTDAQGRYAFTLDPDTLPWPQYCLTPRPFQFEPCVGSPQYLCVAPFRAPGSDWSNDSDIDPRNVRYGAPYSPPIHLSDPVDQRAATDMGIVPPDLGPRDRLGGFVWEDTDTDGLAEVDEPRVQGQEVRLFDSQGTHVATTVTDDLGFYHFSGLADGTYRVRFDLAGRPAGTTFTRLGPPCGDGWLLPDRDCVMETSDVDPATISGDPALGGKTLPISGYIYTWFRVNAGIAGPDTGNDRRIRGIVSHDQNANSKRDEGDPGLAGVMVRLYRQHDGVLLRTTTTGPIGGYSFGRLPLGWYVVEFDRSDLPTNAYFTGDDCCWDGTDSDIDTRVVLADPRRARTHPVFLGNDPDHQDDIDAGIAFS